MLYRARMDGNDPDTIRFPADAQAVGVAVATARTFAARQRLDAETTIRLAIVVEELVTNVVEHGRAPHATTALTFTLRHGGVAVRLVDRGRGFDPRETVASTPTSTRGGGVGLAMVLAWGRVESYRRSHGMNDLTLFLPFS